MKTILFLFLIAMSVVHSAEDAQKPTIEITDIQKSFRLECPFKGKFRTATAFYVCHTYFCWRNFAMLDSKKRKENRM